LNNKTLLKLQSQTVSNRQQIGIDYSSESLQLHDEEYHQTDPYPRLCTLAIRPSTTAHQAYISRQFYYGPFDIQPTHRPGRQLLEELPRGLQGLKSFDITNGETPLRYRMKLNELKKEEIKQRGWTTLTELWKKGQQKISEERG
jgi:hypothetical protein